MLRGEGSQVLEESLLKFQIFGGSFNDKVDVSEARLHAIVIAHTIENLGLLLSGESLLEDLFVAPCANEVFAVTHVGLIGLHEFDL
jgi:hypothetical protein